MLREEPDDSENAVNRSACGRHAAPASEHTLFRHIMVPVDLSARNERALGAALGLARERGGRVTLFQVIQRVSGFAPGEFDAFDRRLVERSERKLRQITRKFAEGGFDVRTAVRVGEPAAKIVRATQRERVDLVVMGSHKVRPGGRQRGWGSARSYLSSEADCHTPAIAPTASN